MKKWYLSRTIWLNITTALFGVLVTMEAEVKAVVENYANPAAVWIAIGIINVLLRLGTTKVIK